MLHHVITAGRGSFTFHRDALFYVRLFGGKSVAVRSRGPADLRERANVEIIIGEGGSRKRAFTSFIDTSVSVINGQRRSAGARARCVLRKFSGYVCDRRSAATTNRPR